MKISESYDITKGVASLAMTSTAEIDFAAIDLEFIEDFSIEAAWTGTPTGSFKVQASNTKANWDDIADSSVAVSGAAGSHIWNLNKQEYRWARLVYINQSGTGVISYANAFVKVLR